MSGAVGRPKAAKTTAVQLEFELDDIGMEPESCTRRIPLHGELVYSLTDRSTDAWKMVRVERFPNDTEDGEHNIVWTSRVHDVDGRGGFSLQNDDGSVISETLRRSDFWFLEEMSCMWATTGDVETRLIVPPLSRTMVHTVDQFGVGLKTLLTAWSFRITMIKSELFPVLRFVREVLTWQKFRWTTGIVVYFILRLVLGIMLLCHTMELVDKPIISQIEKVIEYTIDNTAVAIFVIVMCRFAVHFGWLRSFVRISSHFWRKRDAPDGWKFAKVESKHALSSSPG